MHIADNLLALEKIIEQGVLGFFVQLGAGPVPETWDTETNARVLITAQSIRPGDGKHRTNHLP